MDCMLWKDYTIHIWKVVQASETLDDSEQSELELSFFLLTGVNKMLRLLRKYSAATPAASNLSTNAVETEKLENYVKYLLSVLPTKIDQVSLYKDEISVEVKKENLLDVMYFLRDHSYCQFKQANALLMAAHGCGGC